MKQRFLAAAFLLILFTGAARAEETPGSEPSGQAPGQTAQPAGDADTTVRLAWDPSPNKSVVGYKIRYGVESGKYTKTVKVEGRLNTVADIKNLEKGKTYFFVVSAYDARGKESTLSQEVSNTPGKAGSAQSGSGERWSPRVPPPSGDQKIPPKDVRTNSDGKMPPSR